MISGSSTILILLLLPPNTNTHVVFESIGEMAGALSYVHVTMELDLGEIETQLVSYSEGLNIIHGTITNHTYEENWKKDYDSYVASLKQLLDHTQERFGNMIDIHGSNVKDLFNKLENLKAILPQQQHDEIHRLEKRFVGLISAIAGTFMGLYSRAQMDAIKEDLYNVKQTQQHFIKVTTTLQNDIRTISTELDSLTDAVRVMTLTNPAYLVSALSRAERQLERALQKAQNVIQQAQHRRLSVDFLNATSLARLFTRLQRQAEAAGCKLIPEHPSDLFQLEMSYFYEAPRILMILHVPMAPTDSILRLFRFRPFPLPLDATTALLPTVDADVLAISYGDRYSVELRHTDLLDCHRMNKFFLCERHGVLRKTMTSSCLGALWNQEFEKSYQLCTMMVQPHIESVLQLENNNYLIYTPTVLTAPIKCLNGTDADLHLRAGTSKQTLSPSCRCLLNEHVIIADMSINIDFNIKHFEWNWDNHIFDVLTSVPMLTSIEEHRTNGIDHFLLSDVIQTQTILNGSRRTLAWIVFGLFLTFALLVVAAYFYGFNRLLKLRESFQLHLQALPTQTLQWLAPHFPNIPNLLPTQQAISPSA